MICDVLQVMWNYSPYIFNIVRLKTNFVLVCELLYIILNNFSPDVVLNWILILDFIICFWWSINFYIFFFILNICFSHFGFHSFIYYLLTSFKWLLSDFVNDLVVMCFFRLFHCRFSYGFLTFYFIEHVFFFC